MTSRERVFAVADRVQRIQLWIAATALMILMGVTVVDVFLRYVFRQSGARLVRHRRKHAAGLRVQRHGGGILPAASMSSSI